MPNKNSDVVDMDMLASIREVNLSYLMVAQNLLRKNLARGMFTLGLNEDAATILLSLRPAQVMKIASSGSLVCSFRLNDAQLLSSLRLDEEDFPMREMQRHHRMVMLLSQHAVLSHNDEVEQEVTA